MDFIYKLILLLILNFYNITNSAWVNKRELDFINSIPELELNDFERTNYLKDFILNWN